MVNSLTSRFTESNTPTSIIVRCHSSGLEGMTTYSIASPSSAAATARLVTKIGNGGILERVSTAKYYSGRFCRNLSPSVLDSNISLSLVFMFIDPLPGITPGHRRLKHSRPPQLLSSCKRRLDRRVHNRAERTFFEPARNRYRVRIQSPLWTSLP